mmetsp:Transcript_7989/g.14877  ORF Transcript_7989/g.14877 Transcript_7989/m.14877 type:complete len:813 (+) Transcript_7989:122-2560(+)
MAARDKESGGAAASDALVPFVNRVEVPVSSLPHFLQPEVHMSLQSAAKLLGFAGPEELKKYAAPLLKHFEPVETLGPSLGAEVFNRLVVLCSSKTPAARQLLQELSTSWRNPGGRSKTVDLPAEPISIVGSIPRWPGCAAELVGMEREPLERVRQYLQWRTRMKHFAGLACGIVRNGSLVFYQDAGFADAENKVKMNGDTIVRLFSMTKCLVAAAFMTYLEEPSRNIDLDDPLSKYIPAFSEKLMAVLPKRGQKDNQPLEKAITLRQLLTHTSGIGYGATLDDPWPPAKGSYYKIYEELSEKTQRGEFINLEQWCNALAKIPLKGQPGRYWDYSYSLDVMGRVLEVVAGKPLDVVIEERICGPLKMRDTKFSVSKENAHRIGPWYKSVEIEGNPKMAHRLEIVDPGGEQSGWVGDNVSKVLSAGGTLEVPLAMKGGMVSTFNDYLRFLMMLRNFGELDGVRVLKKETTQLMTLNHVPVACNKRNVFVFDKPGLGFSCLGSIQGKHEKQDKGTYPGEYGWGGLAGPAWTIDPRSDLIILSITQTAFVLDHEEYVRYAARRAIHQHVFGSVNAPSKATSYSPESFDVMQATGVKPGQAKLQEDVEQELEQEHLVSIKTRIRGAKERAICPGPRLDRHPSEEERSEQGNPLGSSADDDVAFTPGRGQDAREPERKRRRSLAVGEGLLMASPGPASSSTSPSGKQGIVVNTFSPGPEDKNQLLFTRVAIRSEEVDIRKARVTAVAGDEVEIVTEGSWQSMKTNISNISVIDESQFGVPSTSQTGPSDFGFLLPKDSPGGKRDLQGRPPGAGSYSEK